MPLVLWKCVDFSCSLLRLLPHKLKWFCWQFIIISVYDALWHDLCVCKVAGLRRQLLAGRDAAMEEVQLRNKFLSEKLECLEQAFASRQPVGISQVINIPIQLIC